MRVYKIFIFQNDTPIFSHSPYFFFFFAMTGKYSGHVETLALFCLIPSAVAGEIGTSTVRPLQWVSLF